MNKEAVEQVVRRSANTFGIMVWLYHKSLQSYAFLLTPPSKRREKIAAYTV